MQMNQKREIDVVRGFAAAHSYILEQDIKFLKDDSFI